MRSLGRIVSAFFWWTYPRGSLPYDVMVGLILAFIFLTPSRLFRDQPRLPTSGFAAAWSTPLAVQAASPQATPLQAALAALDRLAPTLHSLTADAATDDYTALVNDHTRASGKLFFRKNKSGPDYCLDLTRPPSTAKRLIYRANVGYLWNPTSKQLYKYPVGDKQSLLDQYLLLGFGSTTAQLQASFSIAYTGSDAIGTRPAAHLTLTPLHPANFAQLRRIELWIDASTALTLQQQFWQSGGDYHQVTYTSIKLNPSVPDAAFATTFPGATIISQH